MSTPVKEDVAEGRDPAEVVRLDDRVSRLGGASSSRTSEEEGL
jgi:hypothetical protein